MEARGTVSVIEKGSGVGEGHPTTMAAPISPFIPNGFVSILDIFPGRSPVSQLVVCLSSGTVSHPIGSPGQPFSSSPLALTPLLPNRATIRYLLLPIPSPSDYPSRRHPPQTKIIRLHLFLGLAAWCRHM